MKIYLLFVGKPKDKHLNGFAEEFIKRATRYASVEMREIEVRKVDPFVKYPEARHVLLDPQGEALNSHEIAGLVKQAEESARDLVFTIGPHDGLPEAWRGKGQLLSISRMTFTHELARAILAEQIYRALTMLRGHPYSR